MKLNALTTTVAAGAFVFASASNAAISYSNDFESYDPASGTTLGDDGWLVGANVFDSGGGFVYNYFAFPAPNGTPGFSGVAVGEGGAPQGAQQLNTYSDYNNANHFDGSGFQIEANIFRDVGIIGAGDIGTTVDVTLDAKLGNIVGSPTTAAAFIKVIKTSDSSFATLASTFVDTHTIAAGWQGISLSLALSDAAYAGETLQIGFINVASGGADSGVFYDNINVTNMSAVPVPAAAWLFGSALMGLAAARRK